MPPAEGCADAAMIQEKHGNLLQADAEALVNTVNTVGYMGKGIALQFKQAFPENFRAYARAAKAGEIQPGKMFVFRTSLVTNPRFNFEVMGEAARHVDEATAASRAIPSGLRAHRPVLRPASGPRRACELGLDPVEALRQGVETRLHLVPQPTLGGFDGVAHDPLDVGQHHLPVEPGQGRDEVVGHGSYPIVRPTGSGPPGIARIGAC
jgi:hypothetical protein